MKILHVISSTDPKAGGPVEGIKQLCTHYGAFGVDAEILCSDAPDSPWLSDVRLPVVHAVGRGLFKYRFNPPLLRWLRQNHSKYDAVIVNGLWQYHSLAVKSALKNSPTPYFVFAHGMLDPWFKNNFPVKHLKKVLYWNTIEHETVHRARRVIFTCEEEKLLARRSFRRYSVREAVTNYGTTPPPKDKLKLSNNFFTLYPELRNKRIILFLGRIHPKKGCDLLIEAFSSISCSDDKLHLVIAGPDQDGWKDELQKLARSLGIDSRVSWLGMLEGDTKWGALHSAEAFCLPSHQENFGIVVAEALACHLPVLISNKVNIWREILSDKAGFVDDNTREGTIRNLKSWLSLPAKDVSVYRQHAFESFERRFHSRKAAETLAGILRGHYENS